MPGQQSNWWLVKIQVTNKRPQPPAYFEKIGTQAKIARFRAIKDQVCISKIWAWFNARLLRR